VLLPIIYRVENIYRTRYVLIATAVGAAILCAYFSMTAVVDLRRMWRVERSLHTVRLESADLARRARAADVSQGDRVMASGGTEMLAVCLSDWAEKAGIRIESLTPQGSPFDVDVVTRGVSLGKCTAGKVNARGRGRFESVMALLDRLRSSPVPVRLDAFSFEGSGDGSDGSVLFEFLMTTYEAAHEAKS